MILSRERIVEQRREYEYSSDHVALADAALHLYGENEQLRHAVRLLLWPEQFPGDDGQMFARVVLDACVAREQASFTEEEFGAAVEPS